MNVEKAADFLRSNHLPYWRVEKGGKNACKSQEASEDEKGKTEIGLDDSIQFFQENMDLFEDGSYTLVARKNPKGSAGELRFPFKKGSLSTAAPASVNGFVGTVESFKSEMQQTMNARLEAMELKQKIEMLEFKHKLELEKKEKEIKEAKKGDSELPLDKIAGVLAQVSGLIKQANGAPATIVPIQGTSKPAPVKQTNEPSAVEITEASPEEQSKLENAVNEIQQVIGEDELLPAMESLARLAKSNPEQFKGYMQMLKN